MSIGESWLETPPRRFAKPQGRHVPGVGVGETCEVHFCRASPHDPHPSVDADKTPRPNPCPLPSGEARAVTVGAEGPGGAPRQTRTGRRGGHGGARARGPGPAGGPPQPPRPQRPTTLFWDYGCYVSLFTVGGMTVVGAGWFLGYAWLDAAQLDPTSSTATPLS